MKQQNTRPPRTLGRRTVVATALATSVAVAAGNRADAAVARSGAPVSVVDAGAVGDGVTDDTWAVRAAVAQAVSEGRTLAFPAGTYLVDAPIIIRNATSFSIDMKGCLKRKDDSTTDSLIRFVNCTNLLATSLRTDGNVTRNGKVQSDGNWYPVDEVKHDVRLDACVGVWIGYLESVNPAGDSLYLSGGSNRCSDVKIEHINASADGLTGRSVVSVVAGDNLQFGTVRSRNVGCNVGVFAMPGGFQVEPNAGDSVSNVQVDNLIVHTAGATGLGIWSPRGQDIRNVHVGSCRLHKLAGTHPNACDVNLRGVVTARIGFLDHTSDTTNTNQVLSIDQSDDVEIDINAPRLGARPVNVGYFGLVSRLRLTGSLADSTSHLIQIFNLNDAVIDVTLRDCGSSSAYVTKSYFGTSSGVRLSGDWRRGARGNVCLSGSGQIDNWFLMDVDMTGWNRDTRIKQGGANFLHKVRKRRVEGLTTATARPIFDTWGQGDFVENLAPIELGLSGSKYIVKGWMCTGSGYASAATWVECRMPTGG